MSEQKSVDELGRYDKLRGLVSFLRMIAIGARDDGRPKDADACQAWADELFDLIEEHEKQKGELVAALAALGESEQARMYPATVPKWVDPA